MSKTNNVPEYVLPEGLILVSQMRKRLEKRLDELEVEGILARYRSLPVKLREKFLKIVLMEYKESKSAETA